MAPTTTTVTCPHCEAEIDLRIETQAAVAPLLELPFATVEEFAQWLKASGLSVEDFKRLPAYEWHRDQLEPLTRALTERAEDEAAEWHRDQLEPLTRELADDAGDEKANAAADRSTGP
jgi:acetylornithine deacetylase/succinyl-diaminopimelate desuccinylase-like protein